MTTSPMSLRAARRLIAVGLAVGFVVPGTASAHYAGTCPPQGVCDDFRPSLDRMGPTTLFTDDPSDVNFAWGVPDKSMPVVDVQYFLPSAWQLSFASLKPAKNVDGTAPAADCKDAYESLDFPARGGSASVKNAENIGLGTAKVATTSTRGGDSAPRNFAPLNYGDNPSARSLVFLNWNDATKTANLCMYIYATDFRADHSNDASNRCNYRRYHNGADGGSAGPPLRTADPLDPECERARDLLIPVTISRVSDPGAPQFGWKVHYDFAALYRVTYLSHEDATMLSHAFTLVGLNGGNYDTRRIAISRTPALPGQYEFKEILSTCTNGVSDPVAPPEPQLMPGPVCKPDPLGGSALKSVSFSSIATLRVPPRAGRLHDFGRMTGPVTAGIGGPFGFIRNATGFTVSWAAAATSPAMKVKAYTLSVARPADSNGVHEEYIVVDPARSDFDTRAPCGPAGTGDANGICSLALPLPLSTSGSSEPLGADGEYDVALVTIFNDGVRSDRRCDNGAFAGAECAPDVPAIQVAGAGTSTWQVIARSQEWPDSFVETQSFAHTGGGPSFSGPAYILLVNFPLKQAEFLVWNVNPPCDTLLTGICLKQPRPAVYRGASNLISGTTGAGGLVTFDGGLNLATQLWRFDGVVMPGGCVANADAAHPTQNACGVFSLIDLKNPNVDPKAIMDGRGLADVPTAFAESFGGMRF